MNTARQDHSDDIFSPYSVTFLLIHLSCFAVLTGLTSQALVLGLALYGPYFRDRCGYHHTLRTGLPNQSDLQFGLAFCR